jgi:hypothetical protein
VLAVRASPHLEVQSFNNKKMSETLTATRPTWNEEMVKELAQIVGKQVNEWCNDETPLEDCIETAEKVLQWHSNDTGYELAKEFEDEGFSPDSELVEILDSASYDRSKVQETFVKKWVAENGLKLELIEGQKVIAKLAHKGEVEGEIVKLYPETMQYGFWHENQGREKGKGHTYINFENVVSVIA